MNQKTIRIIDILNNFITSCVRSNVSYREQNCLSLGCRFRREDSNGMPLINCPDVECFFSNTIKSILEWSSDWAPLWSRLASRIGEILMRRLLSRPIFCPVDNGCFIQVAGIPISEIIRQISAKRSTQDKVISNPYTIRKKDINSKLYRINQSTKPLNIIGSTPIPRFSIFYRSSYTRHAGLPRNHIIFRKDTNGNKMIEHVFQLDIDTIIEMKTDEHHIFNKLSELFEDIIVIYKSCNIFESLTKHCPLPTTTTNKHNNDSSIEQNETLSSNFPTQSTLSLSGFQSQSLLSLPDNNNNNIIPLITIDNDDDDEHKKKINNNKKLKKTKRGCRGGINKNRTIKYKNIKTNSQYNNNNNDNDNATTKIIRKQMITVGERLFQKVLNNARTIPIDEGFQSQDQDEDYVIGTKRTYHPINDSNFVQKSKKLKQNIERFNDSDDNNIVFPYTFTSSEGSNSNVAIDNNVNTIPKVDEISFSTCHDIGLQVYHYYYHYCYHSSSSSSSSSSLIETYY